MPNPNYCPKKPYRLQCTQNAALVFPASCDSWRCPVCGARKLIHHADVISFAARQHRTLTLLTLTAAPANWNNRRVKIRNLRRGLARRGVVLELAWATEPNSEGLHVHGLAQGQIRLGPVAEVWGARVDARPVNPAEARGVLGYMLKRGFRDLEDHLDLNGGRGVHYTRGFLGADFRTTSLAMRVDQGTERLTYQARPIAAHPGTLPTA